MNALDKLKKIKTAQKKLIGTRRMEEAGKMMMETGACMLYEVDVSFMMNMKTGKSSCKSGKKPKILDIVEPPELLKEVADFEELATKLKDKL